MGHMTKQGARPCPKPVCFGIWASFDPFEAEWHALIGQRFLPWIEECISLLLRCVCSHITPGYKYSPIFVEMVSNKPLDAHILCAYTGIDGLRLVIRSCQ